MGNKTKSTRNSPRLTANGIPERRMGSRRTADQEVIRREEWFRALIENSSDGITILNSDGTIRYESPSIERILGYKPEELIGKNVLEFVHPDDVQNVISTFNDSLAEDTGQIPFLEVHFLHKDGSWHVLEGVGKNLLDDPVVNGIVVNYRDVTERQLSQEALRESEEKFRAIFHESAIGKALVDIKGKPFELNAALQNMLGYNLEELRDITASTYLYADEAMHDAELFRELVKGKRDYYNIEKRYIRKDGEIVWAHQHLTLLRDAQNRPRFIIVMIEDITERKKAEETARRSNAYFRSLIENSLDGIMILNADGTIRYQSPSYERILGLTAEERIGASFLARIHPDDAPRVVDTFAQSLENGGSITYAEVRAQHKDGSWRDVEAVGNNLLDDPDVQGIVVNIRDVTERKQAENALRESEAKFRSFVEQMNDGYGVVQDSQIVFANARIAAMFGYTQDEVISKGIHRFLPPETVWKLLETHAKRRRGEKVPQQYETVLTRKDGTSYPIEFSTRLIEYAGRPATSVVVRDITERKKAEDALRESEEHYSALVENLSDAAFHFKDGFVVWCNDKVNEIYGYTKDDFIGKDITFFLPDETDPVIFIKESYKVIKERGHLRGTAKVKARDGSPVDVEYSISKIPGRYPIELVAVARNITEQKRMGEQLQLAGRLAAVGELAAGVAHELNNPLAAVQAFAEFLAEKQDLDDTTKDDLQTIYKESQRAAKITSNLLSFARKRKPEKRFISINEVLDKSLELHSYRMKVNNIEVVKELQPNLPWTMADFHQMQQVFVNIITNAEQAMTKAHGKGKLIVKTQEKGNVIQIIFSDDGPGISEEDLKSIFNPFFTTKEVGEGTGLGLSICYGIVQEHGSALYAKSKLGDGATFTVEMPIVQEQALDEQVDLTVPWSI
jgi:PAS domain S-box-containing protein